MKKYLSLVQQWISRYPMRLFVGLAVVFGGIFVFVVPPLSGNDEIVHFPRAYQISEGQLWTEHLGRYDYGGLVPAQIKAFNDGFREQVQTKNPDKERVAQLKNQYFQERLEDTERVPLAFTSAGVYSPWAYLPNALGMKLASILNLPLLWYMYLARIASLVVWILLVCLALRLLPVGRFFLIAVALLPVSLVQATTIGMDGITNGISWLIVALTLAILAKAVRLTPKVLAGLAFLALFLATTKHGYVLLAGLPLIIPGHFYPYKEKVAKYLRIGFGVALLLASVWYFARTFPIAETMHFIQRPELYVDSLDQVRYALSNPLAALAMIFIQPFTLSYAGVYAGFVGVLTNRMLYLPLVLYPLLYAGLLVAAGEFTGTKALRKYRALSQRSSVVILLSSFLLISLALYITFTQVGYPTVEGIQGRYFLPLAPLLILLRASSPKPLLKKLPRQYSLVFVFSTILVGLTGAVAAIAWSAFG